MQRTMKKTFSFVLALALVFTMCIGMFSTQAQAADDNTLTITVNHPSGNEAVSGYQYTAYQIFSGTYAETDEGDTLGDIDWGINVDTENFDQNLVDALAALFADTEVSTGGWTIEFLKTAEGAQAVAEALGYLETAADFADIMAGYIIGTGYVSNVTEGDGVATIYPIPDGYYLIEATTVPDNGEYSGYMMTVVGGGIVAIEDKEDIPVSDKTIDDVNDSDTSDENANEKNGTSADYDIGDEVPFTLTGTVSKYYDEFIYGVPYSTTFHDVMTDGLTFSSDSVVVYIVIGGESYDVTNSGYITVNSSPNDGCSFEVTITDFNAVLSYVSEQYKVTGFDADTDYIKVTFTATLNENALIGNAKGEDNPTGGYYGDGEYGNMNKSWIDYSNDARNNEHKGTTTPVEVGVFTYTMEVNKVQPEGDGYVPLDGAVFSLQKLIDDETETDSYTIDGKTYYGTWTDWNENETVSGSKEGYTSDEFTWKGIDDGIYRITESVTPAGYNSVDDIYLVVTAEHKADGSGGYVTTLSVKTYDANGNEITATDGVFITQTDDSGAQTGVVIGDVVNQKGSTLPSTGGIGTTIFYIVGAGIVLCAVVVLVTRRRMRRAA